MYDVHKCFIQLDEMEKNAGLEIRRLLFLSRKF